MGRRLALTFEVAAWALLGIALALLVFGMVKLEQAYQTERKTDDRFWLGLAAFSIPASFLAACVAAVAFAMRPGWYSSAFVLGLSVLAVLSSFMLAMGAAFVGGPPVYHHGLKTGPGQCHDNHIEARLESVLTNGTVLVRIENHDSAHTVDLAPWRAYAHIESANPVNQTVGMYPVGNTTLAPFESRLVEFVLEESAQGPWSSYAVAYAFEDGDWVRVELSCDLQGDNAPAAFAADAPA